MFGGQTLAIKAFIVILFVSLVAWILYLFNFSLPKLNINIAQDKAPTPSRASKPSHVSYSSSTKTTSIDSSPHEMGQPLSSSILKKIIKQKVEEKIYEKEPKIRPTISFSKDKPTFDTSIMHSGVGESTTIDEKFLMEKAQALQAKLMEFNVPIRIEGFDI